ncbi:MAG: pitrilysin family protein [Cyclobacteriaceae bacterium]
MIKYDKFELSNGLKVIVHQDKSTTLAAINILYDVGSRDEHEDKTGFAHLFEHLMFGGSKNIPSYDEPLQKVGGENNAFTTPDITNYYLTLPAANLETGFWLESDRMMSLSFNPEVLEVQRKVVIEEFKQRYLDQPYGDVWLKLRPLAYKSHSYRWATIGKEISHIEQATMDDVRDFFFRYYRPNNAIMVVAGNVEFDEVKRLSEKYFEPIPAGEKNQRDIPKETSQTEERITETASDVPLNAIHKVFHMPARGADNYHSADLLSDLLGRGKSSRLYDQLVKKQQLFNSLNAYVMGSLDPGLLVIAGKLNGGVDLRTADSAIWSVIEEVKANSITENDLEKVKNQAETSVVFGEVELLNRAMNLALATLLGDTDFVNTEKEKINRVTLDDIHSMAGDILVKENSSTLYYKTKRNEN